MKKTRSYKSRKQEMSNPKSGKKTRAQKNLSRVMSEARKTRRTTKGR